MALLYWAMRGLRACRLFKRVRIYFQPLGSNIQVLRLTLPLQICVKLTVCVRENVVKRSLKLIKNMKQKQRDWKHWETSRLALSKVQKYTYNNLQSSLLKLCLVCLIREVVERSHFLVTLRKTTTSFYVVGVGVHTSEHWTDQASCFPTQYFKPYFRREDS